MHETIGAGEKKKMNTLTKCYLALSDLRNELSRCNFHLLTLFTKGKNLPTHEDFLWES